MYKRCIFDKTGLEPRNLFNLVQFLMYDIAGRCKITVEDTLELIYVRYPEQLEEHIHSIFGDKEKTDLVFSLDKKFDSCIVHSRSYVRHVI